MSPTQHTQHQPSDLVPSSLLKANSSTSSSDSRRSSGETQQSPSRAPPYRSFQAHRYRGSTSSVSGADSTTSSPMTSSSLPEQSHNLDTPSTSPDTPSSARSYTYNYPPQPAEPAQPADPRPGFRFAPSPTSIKRQKNPKNLALNTAGAPTARAVATASLPLQNTTDSQPQNVPADAPSPYFVKPEPPRRKSIALGLTLKTPSNSDTFGPSAQIPKIPLTPSLSRPPIPPTPTVPLQVSDPQDRDGPQRKQFASPIREASVEDDPYDLPESREGKPEAYPDGPICIYDPHVYLYFEPTAQEAADYDVIFNVASEVQNPFLNQNTASFTVTNLQAAVDTLPGRSLSFKAADQISPVPYRWTKPLSTEYIHVPWEHNSEIVPGADGIPPLNDIIRVIDDRVSAGKRVLIHCQCGVSRSASLIVAYGIYKNPSITVQEAYDVVKQKSTWIGPNMNLIMQLQNYRNILLGPQADRSGQKSRGKVLHGRLDSDDPHASEFSVPQTAPLPTDSSPRKTPSPIQIDSSSAVSPGPSSAPSDFHWPPSQRSETPLSKPAMVPIYPSNSLLNPLDPVLTPEISTGKFDSLVPSTFPGALPTRTSTLMGERTLASQTPEDLVDHVRSEVFAMAPSNPVIDDPSFGITSPRDTNFAPASLGTNPFGLAQVTPPQQSASFSPLAPLPPPKDDPSLGLFSPRSSAFPSNVATLALLPPGVGHSRPDQQALPPTTTDASASPPQLGSGTFRSTLDLRERSEHKRFPPIVAAPIPMAMDMSDELMSPRATEFTSNPFHVAFPAATAAPPTAPRLTSETKSGATKSGLAAPDPRSPAQSGLNPIYRNISDVLEPS